ncbi:MAG: hypothetical protein IE931_03150 [Sphingobacteriales bacterium]|nr:hypothetical protein [Sphingobacteriales bacterium]
MNKRLIIMLCTIIALLCIPLVAMQFTHEVNWSISDFIIMGILLSGTALLCELILRIVKKTKHRIILCGSVLLSFLLIWAELAVGIFNSPIAGN